MEEFLDKKYVLVGSENFEDYLAHIGVGYFARKAALALKSTQCLTRNEDSTYSYEFSSVLASYKTPFRPGEPFVEEKPDGVKTDAIITFDDNKMIHTQTEANGRTSKHVREFYDDRMVVTTTVDGLNKTVTRQYVLVK